MKDSGIEGGVGVSVDPVTGKVVVIGSPDALAMLGDALAAPGIEAVETSAARRSGSRQNDASPHYGGARIYDPDVGSGNYCTAGFRATRNSDGRKGIVTAQHCGFSGSVYNNGSGNYYGYVWANAPYWPTTDATFLSSNVQTYSTNIYVDPCCPSVRAVVSGYNPYVGQSVCHSGSTTLANCGHVVNQLNAIYVDTAGTTYNVFLTYKVSTSQTIQGGDSGGPVYTRLSGNRASIKGLVVASTTDNWGWHQQVNTIEATMGLTVP